MTEWVTEFDYPAQGWLPIAVDSPDGAERAAQEIADRDGEWNQPYAEAVYPELKAIWEGMRARRAAPVVVHVPLLPLGTWPLAPASVFVTRHETLPEERTMTALADMFSSPRPDVLGKPDITSIELPLGPACRVHQMLLNDIGDDGRQFVIEHIDYFVLPPVYPEGVFQLAVTWSSPAVGPEMIVTADGIAASLTAHREPEAGMREKR